MQNALNLQAQGGGCTGDGTVDDTVTSWLVEASAEWASAAYFPNDYQQRRTDLFTLFQRRDPGLVSLQAMGGPLLYDYQAFLYPLFVQQEEGGAQGRTAYVNLWKTSGAARSAAQLNDLLDKLMPLEDHFRDFGVRNFNTPLPGAPVATFYDALDPAISRGLQPKVLAPTVSLNFPFDFSRAVLLQPLTAQYEHFMVDPHIQAVRVDLQGVQNSAFVQADVLANVNGTWQRRKVPGLVFEFCREDPGDDIQEFYLIVSHHDRKQGTRATGTYQLRTRFDCPTGWQGTIRYVETLHDTHAQSGPSGSDTYDRSEREVQLWTVVDTSPAGTPQQTYDQLTLHWNGTYERQIVDQFSPAVCLGDPIYSLESVTGTGDGTDFVGVFPLGAGAFAMSPSQPAAQQIDCTGSSSFELCTGQTGSSPITDTRYDYLGALFGVVQGLSLLAPDENNDKHYAGSATVLHSDMPQDGGSVVIDQTVSWDFTRR